MSSPYHPAYPSFVRSSESHNLVAVYRHLTCDHLTPVLAYRRLVRGDGRLAPSFLFESVIGGDRIGRYSCLGARPITEVVARGHDVEVRHHACGTTQQFPSEDPLAEVARLTANWCLAPDPTLPAFTGGWVGSAGYDTVRYLEGEKLPDAPDDDRGLPDLHLQLYRDVIVFDHVHKTMIVITHALFEAQTDPKQAYADACQRVDAIVETIGAEHPPAMADAIASADIDLESARTPPALAESNMGKTRFQEAVSKAKAYIAAGDIFQVVLSQRFDIRSSADPFDVYRSLRVVNPSPYMFYLQIDGAVLVGSSPEILCRVQNGVVTNRPLAGTRRRGLDEAEDLALEQELLADPKERAEHVMLVDLGRNDVGRVAEPGSIDLPQVMRIERYSHVMHISSTVTGTLAAANDCWDALRFSLPVGTVSGAPKVRAMQIIDELEMTRRGPYAGAVGYADFNGNMDMAIALRTIVATPVEEGSKRWVYGLQAGAGIVADSVPASEDVETQNKAAALARAIEMAETIFAGQ